MAPLTFHGFTDQFTEYGEVQGWEVKSSERLVSVRVEEQTLQILHTEL